jgi:capsular polysaccharide biosynthesis protein
MALKSLTFVKSGSEPKATRSTQLNIDAQTVLDKLRSWPQGQSLTVECETQTVRVDGKDKVKSNAYALARKINKSLDPKMAEAYRVGHSVVVRKLEKGK